MKVSLKVLLRLFVFLITVLHIGCKKEPPKLIPTLSTIVSNITSTTATATGNVVDDGGADITTKGFCWDTLPDPTTINQKTTDGAGAGTFATTITGLIPGTLYYVRSYAVNNVGTGYGNTVTVTTPAVTATITTSALTAVSATTATCGGNILNDGGALITARGVCWDVIQNPTILNAQSVMTDSEIIPLNAKTTDGTGTGMFTSSIIGLIPGSTYYFRAYATNSAGTSYGNQVVGTTNAVIPTLTTTLASKITSSSFSTGGAITFDGGSAVSARGVCWSTTQNPSIADNKTNDGTGPSSFISNITGLSPGTIYYVRAYATNSMGTAYGNQVIATTIAVLPIVTTNPVSNITESSVNSGGVITYDGGSQIVERGVCWSTNQNPTINNNKTLDGTGSGSFVSNITGLNPGTIYYIRAYATNSIGTAYGTSVSFNTNYYLGTSLKPVVIDGIIWAPVNVGYIANSRPYGLLFQWGRKYGQEHTNSGNVIGPVASAIGQDVTNQAYFYTSYSDWCTTPQESWASIYSPCPAGWRLPTKSELISLSNSGNTKVDTHVNNPDGLAGRWFGPTSNDPRVDKNIFLPVSGFRYFYSGALDLVGFYGSYWSSTASFALGLDMSSAALGAGVSARVRAYGFSVRCVKD